MVVVQVQGALARAGNLPLALPGALKPGYAARGEEKCCFKAICRLISSWGLIGGEVVSGRPGPGVT